VSICHHASHTVSIIIPTYHEACNLPLILHGITSCLEANPTSEFEIIIVDDNSQDNTREVCQSLALLYHNLKLIVRTHPRGLATAIKKGIDEAKGDIIVTMDADLSHDPSVITKLLDKITKNGADIVVASRFIENHEMQAGFHRIWGSKMLNTFIRLLLNIPVRDVTGGFQAFRKSVLIYLNEDSIFRGYGDYSFALLYEASRKELKIEEVGFKYVSRKNGLSKTRFLKTGFQYALRSFRLKLGW